MQVGKCMPVSARPQESPKEMERECVCYVVGHRIIQAVFEKVSWMRRQQSLSLHSMRRLRLNRVPASHRHTRRRTQDKGCARRLDLDLHGTGCGSGQPPCH